MNSPSSIFPNPGGQIAPEAILGRDALIAEIWEVLEGRSIYMNDLRRIGKTQILVKMQAEARDGWHVVKRDLGGCHNAAEFATQTYRDAKSVLGRKKRILNGMSDLLGKAAGIQIAGVLKLPNGSVAPWKEVLQRTLQDIEEEMKTLEVESGQPERMLFLWDEVPFLLDNIAKSEEPKRAMEVLDALRSFGQDNDRVRFIFTGSIGIHHVLSELRSLDYINSPLNRMEQISPGPLDDEFARDLAKRLLKGAGVNCEDLDSCAEAIAEGAGNVPFYIQKLVSRLSKTERATPETINALLLREIVNDERDDWDLSHYRNRLTRYYGKNEACALVILDAIATSQPIAFKGIKAQVAAELSVDDEALRSLLKLLARDHYIGRTERNEYRFYLDLIRRWWRIDRYL